MADPLHHTAGAVAEEGRYAQLLFFPTCLKGLIVNFHIHVKLYFLAADPVHDPGVALVAGAAPGPVLATPDHDLVAAPTPGHDLALVQTARALEAGPGPDQRVLSGPSAPASHVLSPKIKVWYFKLLKSFINVLNSVNNIIFCSQACDF